MKRVNFFIFLTKSLLIVFFLFPNGSPAQDVVDYTTLQKYTTIQNHQRNTTSHDVGINEIISFSPDGQMLAAVSYESIRLWDVATGKHLKTLQRHIDHIKGVSFSPDGQKLASVSSKKSIHLWEVETGLFLEKITLRGHTDHVITASFSPDWQTLATVSGIGPGDDYAIHLWDVTTGTHLKTLRHTYPFWSVSFSPDGQTLASANGIWDDEEYTIHLWDVETGQHLQTFRGHESFHSVLFSPDGRTITGASDDKNIYLWNVATGQHLKTLQGHTARIMSVSFSPDGQTLASADDHGTIYLWDAKTWRRLHRLPNVVSDAQTISFSPDGQAFAHVSYGHILLWRISAPSPGSNADQVYNNAIRAVMWIVNPGIGEGSGVLIDKESKLAVTNAHVTGKQNTIDVFFPAPDENGELIIDRNFYLTNVAVLKQLGYYTKGHVVAKNEKTDLAIIKLDGIPETSREIDWNLTPPATNAGDLVYILGNPAKHDLWRWTLGEFLKNYGNFLHIQSDVFGGNSGGPVLNKQGTLIGIVARSDRHMNALAIPVRDISRLLSKSQLKHSRSRR